MDSMPATLGLSKRSPRRFLEVGNGKETPEKTQISRFYTAWVESGRSRTLRALQTPVADFIVASDRYETVR